jgi:hypothetical protein
MPAPAGASGSLAAGDEPGAEPEPRRREKIFMALSSQAARAGGGRSGDGAGPSLRKTQKTQEEKTQKA